MTLTFANVQNVTIEQGPVQRLLGIADVRVQTAARSQGTRSGEDSPLVPSKSSVTVAVKL